jgi:uncharacterized membrane protein YuzA (DUF378 family)
MEALFLQKSIEYFTLILIIVGALNWGLVGLFKFNLVDWLASKTFSGLAPVVYILVGLSALVHLFARDYYLPFLGDAVFPCGALTEKVPEMADTTVTVKVAPNVNVVYWAAEPNTKVVSTPWEAYNKYANTGVAKSDANGNVVLKFRKPAYYKVPGLLKRTIEPHVHYRVCSYNGMLQRVETKYTEM